MECSRLYKVNLLDVPAEGSDLAWHLDDDFFKALEQIEIEHGSIDAALRVRHKADGYEVDVDMEGNVDIPCDRCLEPMSQDVEAHSTLTVRLGQAYDDDGDIITVAADTAELDLAWNLFEMVVLAIPTHHTHPDGQCPVDVPFLVSESPEPRSVSDADSPFAKLKDLLAQGDADNK